EKMFRISNIDSTVVMERPKLKNYILEIRKSIASILRININQVSVKATTSEKLGFVGNEEGVKAFATVLLFEDLGD
ncbi:MAG: 2-C-methyl-D-erythritol 2,4-cyclodiphosphate synthase, partial [Ignavibacteriae bacterium]|nr:2-C-methyl-D-erythritol 2,4-cyclodiphosphate synthase [Ignavibacteriota bacterium]